MSHQMKGAITIASVAIGFTAMALTAWMGWVSNSEIENGKKIVGIEKDIAMLRDNSDKTYELLRRISPNWGVNPDVISLTRQNEPSKQ